jgi:tRNA(fMet)-specific endonuclease VapC
MLFVLDTTAFSDLMEERRGVQARVEGLPPDDRVVICPVTRGEILHGIGRLAQGKRRRELESKSAALFAKFRCVSIPEPAGDRYAELKLRRQRKGLPMDDNDLWIAATAMALGAVLVTRDSDFAEIDELQTEDWAE